MPERGRWTIEPARNRRGDGELPAVLAALRSMTGRFVVRGLRPSILVGALAIPVAVGLALLTFVDGARQSASAWLTVISQPFRGQLFADPGRLAIADQKGLPNDPLPLGVTLVHGTGGEAVTIFGLANGSDLSLGVPVESQSWVVLANELDLTFVGAPSDFVGTMNATVELRSKSGKSSDRGHLRLEWTNSDEIRQMGDKPVEPPSRLGGGEPIVPAVSVPTINEDLPRTINPKVSSVVPSPAPSREGPTAPAPAPVIDVSPPVQALDPETMAHLLRLGRDLVKQGDIAAARMAFKRAAVAGNSQAAFELGMTYDQFFLRQWRVVGMAPDVSQAREWYDLANRLGSTEASRQLERLARGPQ